MASSPSPFGKYLRAQRKRERYSQGALAKLIGISDAYLSEIERGARAPLSPERWPALVKALPGVTLAELQRTASMTRPLEIDLAKAPREQAELALALALRIRAGNLAADETANLLELVEAGGAVRVRGHGRVLDRDGAPVAGRAYVYRLARARGWSAIVGVRAHAGRAVGPLDGRFATLVGKPVDLLGAGDPGGAGFFDVPGGLAPGDYALDVHTPDGRELWAGPLTVTDGGRPQDVRVLGPTTPQPAAAKRKAR
jgi:transcriptional regulator with XRE-family HTH domain